MKKNIKGIIISVAFILISISLYTIHYFTFRDSHHIFIYLLGDIAFLPLEVLLVSLVLHKVIEYNDKEERLKKLNVIIGVFFIEAGTSLIELFSQKDNNLNLLHNNLLYQSNWTSNDYRKFIKTIKSYNYSLGLSQDDLPYLREFLMNKKEIMLKILENPILIEHESFTNLIMSIFHLEEELRYRNNTHQLNHKDFEHILIDIQRVYKLLFYEWLMYMDHLRKEYPFLYSFALRTNPLDPNSKIEIGDNL